jgi:hypothetical protein
MKSDLSDGPLKLTGLSESWTSLKQAVSVGTKEFGMKPQNYETASKLLEDRLVTELLRFEKADGNIIESLCPLADSIAKDAATSLNEDGMTVEGEERSEEDKNLIKWKEATIKTGRTGWSSNPVRPKSLCSFTCKVQEKPPSTFDPNPKVKARRMSEKQRHGEAKLAMAMSLPSEHETQRSCLAFETEMKNNCLTKCWTHRMLPWSCLLFW